MYGVGCRIETARRSNLPGRGETGDLATDITASIIHRQHYPKNLTYRAGAGPSTIVPGPAIPAVIRLARRHDQAVS
jgi:hypothetical protein